MFNIGFAELVLVLVIAYVFVGPQDLPKVARWLARQVKRMRGLVKEIKNEVGWDELVSETNDVKRDLNETLKEADVTADLKGVGDELKAAGRALDAAAGEAKGAVVQDSKHIH